MKWPADRISQSSKKSFGMYEKALPMMQAGIDVIHFEVGMPSFDTPLHIKAAAKKALDEGLVHYGDFAGNRNFREALVEKLERRNRISVSVDEMVAEDCRRRDLIYGRLNNMPLVDCAQPEGTIYAFPDISAFGLASAEVAERILQETHVVTEAGSFYGPAGEGHLRICFGAEPFERLEEAMGCLDNFFAGLSKAL